MSPAAVPNVAVCYRGVLVSVKLCQFYPQVGTLLHVLQVMQTGIYFHVKLEFVLDYFTLKDEHV